MKIRGNTVGTTMKRPDFNQTDERKSDYILNNPIPVVNEEDEGKVPVVEDGAYVLKEKNSILELVQDIFAFDEEGPSTKKAPSQLATMNALEGYMPAGAFNDHVKETIIPMQKRIGTLEERKVDKYNWRQIDEFTTEEEALINKDYSSHNIEGIRILIDVPANTLSVAKNFNSYVTTGSGSIWCGYYQLGVSNVTKAQNIICKTTKEFGLWTSDFSSSQGDHNIKRSATSSNVESNSATNKYIKKFASQNTVPRGATFTVYGAFPVTE